MQFWQKFLLVWSCIISMPLLAKRSKRASAKPSTIILLNGTSSAGKTSLVQALQPLLPDFEIAGIDDYSRTHHCNGFTSWRFYKFYHFVSGKAAQGQNMLVDTVLYHRNYKIYDAILQSDNVRLIKILVYCPLQALIAHVVARNCSASALDHRSINQAFAAFHELYQPRTNTNHRKPSPPSLDTTSTEQVRTLTRHALAITPAGSKAHQRLKKTNGKLVQQFRGQKKSEAIAIVPQHPWDLIINSSLANPEELAAQIEQFLCK